MLEFVKNNINHHKNPILCEMISEEFDLEFKVEQLKSYIKTHQIKREKVQSEPLEDEEDGELIGEDYDSEEEKCGNPVGNLHCGDMLMGDPVLCNEHKPKEERDPFDLTLNGEKIPRDVLEFVKNNKKLEPVVLRDELIIHFEKNYKMTEIKMIQSNFNKETKTLPPREY